MKVIAFNGSPRPNGNTRQLLDVVLEEVARFGIETELIQLGSRPVGPCLACFTCFSNQDGCCAVDDDPVNEYVEKIQTAQGILIGSPTYFSDVSAQTKAFIDRVGLVSRANGNMLKRRVGAPVLAVRRAGSVHAFATINYFFLIAEMVVVGSNYWNMGIGLQPGDAMSDKEGIETMKVLGQNMAWTLQKLHG